MKRDPTLKEIPTIMITGRFTEPEDRVQGLELGADEYFAKPFDPVYFFGTSQVDPPQRPPGHSQELIKQRFEFRVSEFRVIQTGLC